MKELIKNTIIMVAITVVAGAALGQVYSMTKEPIAASAAAKALAASKEVFADAADFVPVDDYPAPDGQYNCDVAAVSLALDASGNALGYVVTVTSHAGYNGDITFSMGLRMDGTINGISLLSISETPGLGMKAEEVIKPQFKDRATTPGTVFSVTKTGEQGDDKINAITGATITSKAVTAGVNAALSIFKQ